MDGNAMQCCCRRASTCTPRAPASLSSSTSFCSFQRLRFCLGQPKLLREELQVTVTHGSKQWSPGSDDFRSFLGRSVRCRVIRGVRDSAFASITQGDKQPLPAALHWPPIREIDNTREASLLPFDDDKEERYSPENADRIEDFRDDSSQAEDPPGVSCSDDQAPLPLHSRVEAFEGIPVRKWLSTFVESINPRIRGILILNMLTFLYGSNIAVIKETETMLDPASFSVGRFAIAALGFAPFLKDVSKQPGVTKAGLELGVWASIGYLAQALGLMTTDAGRASFFTTFTVIAVPFFAGLMGKKIPVLTWFAAVAALFGVGLLETSGAPPSVGDAWSLVSAVVFGVHLIRSEFHSRNFSPSATMPMIALQLSVITASSFVWSFASHVTAGDVLPSLATLDWPGLYHTTLELPWGPMLYTGLFSTAFCLSAEWLSPWSYDIHLVLHGYLSNMSLGKDKSALLGWEVLMVLSYLVELVAMRDVSATEAAVITTMEPLWGAGFAWILLGERWGLRGWVGATFILGGSLATQIWGSPETPVKPAKVPLPSLEEQEDLGSIPHH